MTKALGNLFTGLGYFSQCTSYSLHFPKFPKQINRMEKVNIQDKFSLFKDHWNPRVVAELNGQMVKLARLKGPFVWHSHQDEDELFFVIQGTLQLEFRDRTITLDQGEMMVIPRGTEHRPVAEEEVLVMLFEPASTLNTGDLEVNGLTRDELDRI